MRPHLKEEWTRFSPILISHCSLTGDHLQWTGGSGGGGGTLSEIYHSTQRLLLRAMGGLERLERLDSSSSSSSYSFSYASSSSLVPSVEDPGEIATEIKRDIYQIRSLCAEMDHLWRSVPSRGQRDLWKRYEIQFARQSCPMVPFLRVCLLVAAWIARIFDLLVVSVRDEHFEVDRLICG